jgi:mRNA-degrading endonuclease RelE of RelBE toxin-antitoxin system
MPLKVKYSVVALKQLAKMDKSVAGDIMQRIDEFAITGRPSPKPLTGLYKGLNRLRFGGWRVVFEQIGANAIITNIDRRDKVYKR